MTSWRPVSVRASLTAVSFASDPLRPSSTRSRPGGAMSTSASSNATRASLAEPDETWLARSTWSRIAAVTAGCEWPIVAAAKLPARSTYRLPSGSVRIEPSADSTTRGGSSPPVRGPAPSTARIRSMTARARGPG